MVAYSPGRALLTARKTFLYDVILALDPYCDPATHEAAYQAALRNGGDEPRAAVTADGVMILAARDRQRALPVPPHDAGHPPERRAKDLIPLSLALASPELADLLPQLTP
ncbi:DUF6545 domain-containing protein [Streptomyces alanosinicus]|uniref:DUF6545 domain-containing protein n=1 Tax=Streptomyces alanosinicus TaxID=68171 RepID=A0A918YME9_9ACTN|nr:DUF6545 domain-containing protein [Streptomyces alanosinicus]GHE08445.1 hypothetical protein GCM10010339_56880 [Streptomyces alanosinicus]